MSKNLVIIISIIAILVIVGLVLGIYFLTTSPKNGKPQQNTEPENKFNLPAYMLEAYPDYLEGTISFSDNKSVLKTKDKTYKLQPADPTFYQGEGIKDNQKVEIQGKIVKGEYITVGRIK